MKKIYRIFLGWWYFFTNKNNTLARERLKVCVECPKMSKGVCTSCGCVLQAKARIEEEECPDDKWVSVIMEDNAKKINNWINGK